MKHGWILAIVAGVGAGIGAYLGIIRVSQTLKNRPSRPVMSIAPNEYRTLLEHKKMGSYNRILESWAKYVRAALSTDLTELEASRLADSIIAASPSALEAIDEYEKKQRWEQDALRK